jgi:hypothetical protein
LPPASHPALGGLSGIDQQTDCAGAGAAELYRGPGSGWLHKWRRSTPKGLLEPPGSTGHSAPWSWGRLDPATAPRARTAASVPRQRAPAPRPLPRERCAHDAAAPTPPAACPELGHSRSRGHAARLGRALWLLGAHDVQQDGLHIATYGQLVKPLHRQQRPLPAALPWLDNLNRHIGRSRALPRFPRGGHQG